MKYGRRPPGSEGLVYIRAAPWMNLLHMNQWSFSYKIRLFLRSNRILVRTNFWTCSDFGQDNSLAWNVFSMVWTKSGALGLRGSSATSYHRCAASQCCFQILNISKDGRYWLILEFLCKMSEIRALVRNKGIWRYIAKIDKNLYVLYFPHTRSNTHAHSLLK